MWESKTTRQPVRLDLGPDDLLLLLTDATPSREQRELILEEWDRGTDEQRRTVLVTHGLLPCIIAGYYKERRKPQVGPEPEAA